MDKNAYLIKLSESNRTSFGRISFKEQIEEQQVFSSIWELESEVNNGGFVQYFINADVQTVNFAPKALQIIGANGCANIVNRALQTIDAYLLPDDQERRQEIIDGLDDQHLESFEILDQEFFSYPDNLTELLFEYVRKYPNVFGEIFT